MILCNAGGYPSSTISSAAPSASGLWETLAHVVSDGSIPRLISEVARDISALLQQPRTIAGSSTSAVTHCLLPASNEGALLKFEDFQDDPELWVRIADHLGNLHNCLENVKRFVVEWQLHDAAKAWNSYDRYT